LQTVKQFLNDTRLGFAGRDTAIGEAIGLGVKRLIDRPTESRILILLTDGENTAGNIEPLEAAQVASEQKIKIHTIGIYSDFSRTSFANNGAQTLIAIAQQTGGKHFFAGDADQLANVYKELDILEPVTQDDRLFRPKKSYYHYPLTAFFFLLLLSKLTETFLQRLKQKPNMAP